jgi:hypothetical protein
MQKERVLSQYDEEVCIYDFIVKGPRKSDGKFLVRWKGYEEEDDSWVSQEDIGVLLSS